MLSHSSAEPSSEFHSNPSYRSTWILNIINIIKCFSWCTNLYLSIPNLNNSICHSTFMSNNHISTDQWKILLPSCLWYSLNTHDLLCAFYEIYFVIILISWVWNYSWIWINIKENHLVFLILFFFLLIVML